MLTCSANIGFRCSLIRGSTSACDNINGMAVLNKMETFNIWDIYRRRILNLNEKNTKTKSINKPLKYTCSIFYSRKTSSSCLLLSTVIQGKWDFVCFKPQKWRQSRHSFVFKFSFSAIFFVLENYCAAAQRTNGIIVLFSTNHDAVILLLYSDKYVNNKTTISCWHCHNCLIPNSF